jgi:multidrug efflux system outer membrane protein
MSRLRRAAALLLTASLCLAGCASLDPAYRRPSAPVPDAFPHAGGAAGAAPAAATSWRDFLKDPKLRAVVDLGLANNRDLRAALADIAAARALYRVQRADLLPHVNANLSGEYAREPIAAVTGGVAEAGTPTSGHVTARLYTADLGVSSYELDLFGRTRSLTKAKLEQYLSTVEARRATQISLVSEIASAYLTLASDKAVLGEAEETLKSASASLELTRSRFGAGVAPELDVRQAETLAAQARADVQNDLAVVEQDRNALDLLVGTRVGEDLLPPALGADPLVAEDLPAGLPAEVLAGRPDVLEAEHQLKAQNANIGAARAAFFPSITLTGAAGGESTSLASLFSGAAAYWAFAPSVSAPIFAGGANRANLAYAKAERDAALAQYEKAVQSAFREVADALARRAVIGTELAADQAAATAARRSLDLASARYAQGSDTYLNVLLAQRTLYAAEVALTQARLLRAANLVTLYAALGGGAV